MDDDNGLREALRKFMSVWMGEEEIQRLITRPDEMVDAWDDARRQPQGPKTREEILDFLTGLSSSGLTQFFSDYHAEHGVYPEFPSGGPGKLSDPEDKVMANEIDPELRDAIGKSQFPPTRQQEIGHEAAA